MGKQRQLKRIRRAIQHRLESKLNDRERSTQQKPPLTPWDVAREADKFSPAREFLRAAGDHANEWAGIPCPVEGEQLRIAKGYPFKQIMDPDQQADDELVKRNATRFWSWKWRRDVIVFTNDSGKRTWMLDAAFSGFTMALSTLSASFSWSLDAENKACMKLRELVEPHTWKMYMLTGMFLETSKRSGVSYVFRKLRPTIALSSSSGEMRALCTLCLHPIGYYDRSWGGAMVPTDDVIAHLLLMRADEHYLWRKANQHSAYRIESGM